MKKMIIIVSVILLTLNGFSQKWEDLLPQDKKEAGTLTFFDIQTAFNEYWKPYNVKDGYIYENGVKQKAGGWKNFKRWEYFWDNRVNKITGEFPKTNAYSEYKKYVTENPDFFNKNSVNGDWENIGITESEGGYSGLGRFNVIEFHPNNENIFWAGSPSGGLWQTTDGGNSWITLTDNNLVLGVSDIAIPNNFETSNTMYILTGDRDEGSMWALGGASNDNHSIGILKSMDAGNTWQTTGLNYDVTEKALLKRLLIHPTNPEILYCASSNGIFKTINGGDTWTLIKEGSFFDLEFKPQDEDNTLYASSSGKIYKTTDAGENWEQIYSTPVTTIRTDISVTPANPNMIYAISAGNSQGFGGLYKSTDSGNSFEIAFAANVEGHNITGYYIDGIYDTWNGQALYDMALAVSPTNANELWVGGINAWKSTDGGYNWECKTHWWGDGGYTTVHADVHYMKYQNENTLFEVNDGGIYKVTDNGDSWTDITNGTAVSQIYRLSGNVENNVMAGLQDNGTKSLINGEWIEANDGDGMECIVDYNTPTTQYATVFYGRLYRTDDNWETEPTYLTGDVYGHYGGYWVTPYVIDPNDNNTLYVGVDKVYKSTNKGDDWTELTGVSSGNKLRSMATCKANSQVLYVADNSYVWKTTDGGENWEQITNNLSSIPSSLTYIAVNQTNPDIAWATFGSYNGNQVYQTTDGGATWENISNGLPNLPAMTLVHNKLNTTETEIYVGTDKGIYLKIGDGTWTPFMNNFPNVVVSELEIYYNETTPENSRLRAATFGRGVWQSDLYDYNADMIYLSSTSSQTNTNYAEPGNTEQIITIEITTIGSQNPITVNEIIVNMNQTTDINDIENVEIYYTGNSSIFSTDNLFASASVSENDIQFTNTQELVFGTNYFHLAYSISEDATIGNIVDAELISLTTDAVQTPTILNPGNGRQINYEYCEASSTTAIAFFQSISNFTLRYINNDSDGEVYSNFRHLNTQIAQGDTYNFYLTNGQANPSEDSRCAVWIDWNSDGDFEDENELTYIAETAQDIFQGQITVPNNAQLGITTLRARIWDTDEEPVTQCGITTYGEVEDYSVTIVEILDIKDDINSDIYIYPNPNNGNFFIDCRKINQDNIKLEITDITGKICKTQKLEAKINQIKTNNLQKGVYIIKVFYDNQIINKKIIVN